MKASARRRLAAVSTLLLLATAGSSPEATTTYEVIAPFSSLGPIQPGNPLGGLVQGPDGAYYGTTDSGGAGNCGVVYRLAANDTLSVLHNFVAGEGCHPAGDLAIGPDGALYGVTYWTHASNLTPGNHGTVFRVALDSTHSVLHYFTGGADGAYPYAGLTLAPNGLFYGSTDSGVLFTISPAGGDHTVLASNMRSQAALLLGSDGDLYGTVHAASSAAFHCGYVFKMTLAGQVTVLHAFPMIVNPFPTPSECREGNQPLGELVEGPTGSFYGTTITGGPNLTDEGTIFEMRPDGTVTLLHVFTTAAKPTDGSSVWAGLTLGSDGFLYGATTTGGGGSNGTLFRLSTAGSGFEVLRSFDGIDGGSGTESRLLETSPGIFIGTTPTLVYRLTTAVNQAPVAQDAPLPVTEDVATSGTLAATDSTNDPLTYSIVANGSLGTALITDATTGAFTYTPNANVSGTDSFTFKVSDGTFDSNIATISVTIAPVNDAPVSQGGSASTTAGTPVNGTLVATDIDGAALAFAIVTNGTRGTAVVTNAATGAYTYTPAAGQNGSDAFTFKANDGTDDSNVATITVTISPNHPPVALDASLGAEEDRVSRGRVMATDADGQLLTFVLVSNATKGTVALTTSTGRFTYTPNPNANGTDTFTFRASDGIDTSNVATFTITIAAVNDAPVAAETNVTTAPGTPITAVFQASDPDGDALTFTLTRAPRSGTVVINANGTFTYTPNAGFTGTDSFRYRANDGQVSSAQATVSIVVR